MRFRNLSRISFLALLFAVLVPVTAHARDDGIAQGGAGCGSGGGCHGNATGSVSVSVSGPATLIVNATATYTLSVSTVGDGAGLSVETDAGFLSFVDANTKLLSSMITHVDATVAAPTGNIGDWSYDFNLTAPATVGTTITLAFSGNAFDGDGTRSGDQWNSNTFSILTAVPEPGTAALVGLGLGMLGLGGRRKA
jgi:hypothetical protein